MSVMSRKRKHSEEDAGSIAGPDTEFVGALSMGHAASGTTAATGSTVIGTGAGTGTGTRTSSSIIGISRTIAACQRCRQKKTKCDQQFPSCGRCLKAGVDCVGLDPATGREVPRSYVISLENRISHLESLLLQNGIDKDGNVMMQSRQHSKPTSPIENNLVAKPSPARSISSATSANADSIGSSLKMALPNNNDTSSLSFYIGDSSGISFAKLLFTAVNFNPGSINENNSITTRVPLNENDSELMASLPSKSAAEYFVKSYFEQSNTQLPLTHREYFIDNYFKPVYGNLSPNLKLAANYTKMNVDTSPINEEDTWYYQYTKNGMSVSTLADTPERFHKPMFFLNMVFAIASSINLLHYTPETSNSYKQQAMVFAESTYQSEDRLECLHGLLMLTLYSVMRPSTPGVWYMLGTSLRLCVDLGLHTEKLNNQFTPFVKDVRRRLFWCAYSLDRQVCVYLGRPFGIPEESISTKFPVELDDCLINVDEDEDFTNSSNSLPTYKTISLNFFKIRRIQAEILQVLYFTSSTLPRFYNSLNDWKLKIDNQLEHWFKTIPLKSSRKCNCDFNFEFFKLNYYHTKLLLFGVTPKNSKPNNNTLRIIFESSKGIMNSYIELYKAEAVNYTWSAVHNLFMAGTSFFYSIYNSSENLISLDEFEAITTTVMEVLQSLVKSCEVATSTVEIFEILSLAISRLKFEATDQDGRFGVSFLGSTDINDIERFFEALNDKSPPKDAIGIDNFHDLQTPVPMEPVPSASPYPAYMQQTNSGSGSTPQYQDNGGFQAPPPIRDHRGILNASLEENYPSLSTPPGTGGVNDYISSQDFEQQRIFELMNQVSSETIYRQLFGQQSFTG